MGSLKPYTVLAQRGRGESDTMLSKKYNSGEDHNCACDGDNTVIEKKWEDIPCE